MEVGPYELGVLLYYNKHLTFKFLNESENVSNVAYERDAYLTLLKFYTYYLKSCPCDGLNLSLYGFTCKSNTFYLEYTYIGDINMFLKKKFKLQNINK